MDTKISERQSQIKSFLEKYPEKLGIGRIQPNNEVEKILNYTQLDVRKLDPGDCGEAAILLSRSAVYIQLKINEMTAEIKWANKVIDRLIAEKVHEYGSQYSPFSYRREMAIKDNDVAESLYKGVVNAELELDSMSFLPAQLSNLARSYEKMSYIKGNQK